MGKEAMGELGQGIVLGLKLAVASRRRAFPPHP